MSRGFFDLTMAVASGISSFKLTRYEPFGCPDPCEADGRLDSSTFLASFRAFPFSREIFAVLGAALVLGVVGGGVYPHFRALSESHPRKIEVLALYHL